MLAAKGLPYPTKIVTELFEAVSEVGCGAAESDSYVEATFRRVNTHHFAYEFYCWFGCLRELNADAKGLVDSWLAWQVNQKTSGADIAQDAELRKWPA
jgi:hypothetical protein